MRLPFGGLVARASTVAVTPIAMGMSLTATAIETGMRASTAPTRTVAMLASTTSVESTVCAVKELLGGPPVRRTWSTADRCWIEVRGLQSERGRRIGTAVLRTVRAEPGVQAAQLNYPLSRIVVQFDDPPAAVAELSALVSDVETRVGSTGGPSHSVDLPGDGVVLAGRPLATAASGIGLGVATAGRVLVWPRLLAGLSAAVTLADYQPKVRELVEARLGQEAADTVLAIAAATVYAATQAPATVAVELVRQLAQVGECVAAARAWETHEPTLAAEAECIDAVPARKRPRPVPPGPVERYAERSGAAQGYAAGVVGLLTRDLNAAATAAVVTAPKAARNAREAFAATLGRGLAGRHGVLPLRPSTLRLLDRVDAVVVDPRVLEIDTLRVSRLRNVGH